ncbi:hypothetical protein SHELI_v1c00840 [Spiroplasma helicoides]|uniref:Probable cell division protein WhiA n=1 Tax=Spiroplasma helicoides TaxID=216938 RepID=A0A1B3SJD5_9MOLU|nr:DNA-binding protein WhiA [Spiroplasma helicoides]AOG60039.1 hypothetical protein SHELI_v1c00840 [Spiroplasma helicoides]
MSFARNVKEEVLDHIFTPEQTIMLLSGFIKYNGEFLYTNKGTILRLSSQSNKITRQILTLLKTIYDGNIEISIKQTNKLRKDKVYELLIAENVHDFLSKYYIYDIDKNDKIIRINLKGDFDHSWLRAYISGVFIAVGSVNSPATSNYHLEFQTKDLESAEYIRDLLNQFEFGFKVIAKKNKYICYIKRSLYVSDFLRFIDAPKSVLEFENTRITRDVRNNINRMTNIDIYNQHKSENAGAKQTQQIELIKNNKLFSELSEKAQNLANIRLEHQDASFSELEKMMNEKGIEITKSGISNLFKIIAKLAESIGG